MTKIKINLSLNQDQKQIKIFIDNLYYVKISYFNFYQKNNCLFFPFPSQTIKIYEKIS